MSSISLPKNEIFDEIIEKQLELRGIARPPVPCHFINSYAPVRIRLFDWKRLHGAVAQDRGTLLIGLNRNDCPEERRFTLFHEIAHFVLERERRLAGGVFFRHPKGVEHAADLVARQILMPSRWVREAWSKEPLEKK